MSGTQQQFYNVLAPEEGKIAVIGVTTGSVATDLSLAAQLGDIATEGRFLEFHADGEDIHWFMAPDGTGTAVIAATSGPTRTQRLGNGERAQMKLPQGAMFLTMIGATGGGLMRVSVVSAPPGASQS